MGILRIVNKGVKVTTHFWVLVLSAGMSMAQNAPEKMDLYLLIGQSNMAGRGKLSETSQQKNMGVIFFVVL